MVDRCVAIISIDLRSKLVYLCFAIGERGPSSFNANTREYLRARACEYYSITYYYHYHHQAFLDNAHGAHTHTLIDSTTTNQKHNN